MKIKKKTLYFMSDYIIWILAVLLVQYIGVIYEY